MKFTDRFIQRPVLACVISLLIFLLGLRAMLDLPVRQYPELNKTVITVSTYYAGANAALMQGFISAPLQQSIAGVEGIDYIATSNSQGSSSIKVHMQPGYPSDKALTEVLAKVNAVRSQLPQASEDPVISKGTGDDHDLMYIAFRSEAMTAEQVTDYLVRVVQPKLQTVGGVAAAEILGAQNFAMRIWLDPNRLAAYGLQPQDVRTALNRQAIQSAPGQIEGPLTVVNVRANTDLSTPEQYRQLVIKQNDQVLVRLGDVAQVVLGPEDLNSSVTFNGQPATFIGIQPQPDANPLTVIDGVKAALPAIAADLPNVLTMKVAYDSTDYIRASINEVIETIGEATLIVVLVIFLFMGSLRAVLIPVLTIPLSLIGACFLMLVLGYSINLLTLLAMVLAIGLVVDDAIIVVENIQRHIEQDGLSPSRAALKGARELGTAIISMTTTLAAVYAPIGFLGGLTGSLFKEFAFSLAGAVLISGVVALTLSPMLCAKLLTTKTGHSKGRIVGGFNRQFDRLRGAYERALHWVLAAPSVMAIAAAIIIIMTGFMYVTTPSELAPKEDQGFLLAFASTPQYANLDYLTQYSQQSDALIAKNPGVQDRFVLNFGSSKESLTGIILKPLSERDHSAGEIANQLQQSLNVVTGLDSHVINLHPLPGSSGAAVAFVISSTSDYTTLNQGAQSLLDKVRASGLFMFAYLDVQYSQPLLDLQINRDRVAQLGVSMSDLAATLSGLLSGSRAQYFSLDGRSYPVIPQVPRDFRLNAESLQRYSVRAQDGSMVPLSALLTISRSVQPSSLKQFQQLNAITLHGRPMPGVSAGQALAKVREMAQQTLPSGFYTDVSGQSRQLEREGPALLYAFFMAIAAIFLVLAAQFESFRAPLIILVSVPMSICGALIPLNLGLATVNIYTQIGMVTLIGLISKHGILMVEFANQLQRQGVHLQQAIEQAAALRLRPIIMTTAATVLGVMPLLMSTGAGAASRFNIGLVIVAGMTIGTLFTLFMVPSIYRLLSSDLRPKTPAESV